MNISQIQSLIRKKASPEKAAILQRFFKTGKGQYGEGDIFVGVTVPELRKIAKLAQNSSLIEVKKLLAGKVHEDRLVALEILVFKLEAATKIKDKRNQKILFNFYIKNRKHINNWDLVDLSAPYIASPYLLEKNKNLLYKFAHSKNIWDRRISIISTYDFIRHNEFQDTLRISKILLKDEHDLIQKAVGWMLREVGKRDEKVLKNFLQKNYKKMPRTMLRYSIEKFSASQRQKYLLGKM